MKIVKLQTGAEFFFILTSIIFITVSCSQPSSNESDGEKTAIKTESENEILGVYALFRNTIASDGEWDSEEDYNNISQKIDYFEVIEDKPIFYCYDTEYLIKLEIIGHIKNASVYYSFPGEEMVCLVSKYDINGQFVIVPNSKNRYLNGGSLIIKAGNEVLREIEIQYDGCL
uniref:hypothetical protein n=1 Tax=Flavobacterium sp. TaxID=239 RepID=UPI00404B4A24